MRVTDHTYGSLLRDARDQLRLGGIPDWSASAEWLTMDAVGCTRTKLFSEAAKKASPDEVVRLKEWIERRLAREPVQYILGYTEFYGLKIIVNPSVLIPRPETELLVEAVEKVIANSRASHNVLDIGTGSGCIALAIQKVAPDSSVWGCDNSEAALEVARTNGAALDLPVQWFSWDVLDPETALDNMKFSIIVSNPPYIPVEELATIMPEVASFEPHAALFVEHDPIIYYRTIMTQSKTSLSKGGYLFFEVNPDFAVQIQSEMNRGGFVETSILKDLAGHQRIVSGRLDG